MHPPSGVNVFAAVFDVVSTAWTERNKARQEGRKEFDNFLDYAIEEHGSEKVEDVRSLKDVLRVYITIPIFWSCFDQSSSRWVFQARRMDLFDGKVTESQIGAVQPLLVLALIPFFNKCVYPALSFCGINLKPASRIACGFVISGLSFAYAAVLERYINGQPDGTISVGYQLPQYFLLTCGEIMVSITGLEFAYSQAPKSMKGVVSACWLLTVAFGNVIVIIIAAANIGDQELEFWIYVGLINFFAVILLFLTRGFVYKSVTGAAPRKASEVIYNEALEDSLRQ
jgi:dipeptide/tripeptide permease